MCFVCLGSFLPSSELIHGAVEAEGGGELHEGGGGHQVLEDEEEHAPPGQEDDLPVGEHSRHRAVRHKLRLKDWDDLALKMKSWIKVVKSSLT